MEKNKIYLPIVIYGVVVGLLFIVFLGLEFAVIFSSYNPAIPQVAVQIGSLMGTAISAVLTFGLVALYARQTDIQTRQTDILEFQSRLQSLEYAPAVTDEKANCTEDGAVELLLNNEGNGPAMSVSITIDGRFASNQSGHQEQRTVSIPGVSRSDSGKTFLRAEEREWFSFKIDDNVVSELTELKSELDDSELICDIRLSADATQEMESRSRLLHQVRVDRSELDRPMEYLNNIC